MKTNDQEMTNKELQIWIAGELKSFRAEMNGELKAIRTEMKTTTETTKVVNNDKEFAITELGDGKFEVVRNGVAMTMVIQPKGKDTEGHEKFQLEFAEPAELKDLGAWIGTQGCTIAVANKLAMFSWHLANRSEHRGKDPKGWLTIPDFGLQVKVKTKTIKNPKTGKPLTAKEKVRMKNAKELGLNDAEALDFACQ